MLSNEPQKSIFPFWAKKCCKNKSCVQDSDVSGIILIRMSFKIFHTAGLVIVAFLAVSCVEPITLDPMQEMPVVVTCVLTTETAEQSLNLFYAKRPSETEYVSIPGAKVVVREEASSGGSVHEFKWNGEKYVCPFTPRYDTRYLLEVETAGGTSLTAETTMPKHFSLLPQEGKDVFVLKDYSNPLSGAWPPREGKVFYRQYLVYYFALETDAGFEPYAGELCAWISAGDRLSTDHKDADSFNLLPNNWNDLKSHPFFNRRGRMAPEYYQFFSDFPAYLKFIRIHQQQGFSGPASIIGISEPEHENFLFYLNSDITDITIITSEIDNVDGLPEDILEIMIRLVEFVHPAQNEYSVRFVSQEYDAFLKDLAEKTVVHADELSVIYSMEPTHSNIKGGLGIFGAEFYCKCWVFYQM